MFFSSQPELPVVSLSFSTKINEVVLHSIEEKCRDLIKLNMTGSVQIMECVERPGALVVHWDEVCFKDTPEFFFINSFCKNIKQTRKVLMIFKNSIVVLYEAAEF